MRLLKIDVNHGSVMIEQQFSDHNKGQKSLFLIDGYGFVFRAYHSLPPLTRSDGVAVGAVYGFTNMMLKLLTEHQSDYFAVILDAGQKTFRHDIYPQYKANRPPAPEDLIPQFPLVRQAAMNLGLPTIDKQGYEADDIIASYVRQAKAQGIQVVICSSDKDLMQLVDTNVILYDPLKSRWIGAAQVQEKFGVGPEKMVDLLALMGDSSDNIPGIPGIGPKTAAELLQNFGNLETVLASAAQIKQTKRRQLLQTYEANARLSKKLVTLDDQVVLEQTVEALVAVPPDPEKMMAFLQEQGFKSLVKRAQTVFQYTGFPAKTQEKTPQAAAELSITTVTSAEQLAEILGQFNELTHLTLLFQHDRKNILQHLVILCNQATALIIPIKLSDFRTQTSFLTENVDSNIKTVTLEATLEVLTPYLQDNAILKIMHHTKPLFHFALKNNFSICATEDVMLMAYVLKTGLHGHTLDEIFAYYDMVDGIVTDDNKEQNTYEQLAQRSHLLYQLAIKIRQLLFNAHLLTVYERIEKPLTAVLAKMEYEGIKVDAVVLKNLSDDFSQQIDHLQQRIFIKAGQSFNIASPKQLGEVLFDKMGMEGGKKSRKTGAYSTDSEVLEELEVQGYEIAGDILQWRQLSKLKSTYTDALQKQIQPDGRIHTHFAMAATNTGRLSSHDPNLQNIPVRTEEGNRIRRAFIAERGKQLISADYSQIELRLLAHVADVVTLKNAFMEGFDIHCVTASQIFKVHLDDITTELRRKAKTINFGIIYGISAFGLARRLGIPRQEAATYIEQYFEQYPGIKTYMDTTIQAARHQGYVTTPWGRRCYIKNINDKNPVLRQFSERAAINAPLQGGAADIIKKAMISLSEKLPDCQAEIVLQVHDELVVEVPKEQALKTATILRKVMEEIVQLSVPLLVDVKTGETWQQIH